MTSVTIGFAGLAILFTLIGFGMPIGFAMGLIGVAGFSLLVSFDAALVRVGVTTFHMATNHILDPAMVREDDFYLGSTEGLFVWLIYKPNLDWLKSPEAALTLARAKTFAASAPDKRHLVFAAGRRKFRRAVDTLLEKQASSLYAQASSMP